MAARGMRWHAGRYRSEQEIELVELDKMREQAEAHWFSELKRLKGWLRHRRPERVREAQAAITAIEDPHAAPALVRWLDNENDEWTRRLLLDVLYLLDHPLVMSTLVDLSIHEETDDLRLLCVDYLTRDRRRPPLKPYVDWLSSKDNRIVNRAAQALAAIGDGEAVSPLIDALVTRHKFIVSTGNPGQINASMTNGGGGFTAGGNAPKVEFRDLNNTDVLRALSQLTGGVDFGYDERAWRRWFVNEQKVDFSASRRDL